MKRLAIFIILICVITLVVAISWYMWEAENNNAVNKGETIKHQIITGKTPDDFFMTFPKPVEIIKSIEKPKVITEPPKAETKVIYKWFKSDDLFKEKKKPKAAKKNKDEIKRNAILTESLFGQQFIQEVVTLEKVEDTKSFNDFSHLNKDEDFSEHGVPSITATYPVDLERVLTMNKHIPAVLYTEIHTEIPSDKVIAVIEQNVTGYHGNKILIPRGSQAVGKFGSLSSPDSERMGILWYRVITPEGINISLNSEAVDQEGASGLTGIVDKRWKDKYGTALLFSSISALAQLSVPVDNENVKAAADSFSSELGTIVTEQLRQSLSIVQRINIPKGSRLNISPLVDIWFKESEGQVSTLPLNTNIFNIGGSK
tara:strand:- start:19711 stop:20823 length:1113 start_codon:yes stop_codon:yes gene_type:complete